MSVFNKRYMSIKYVLLNLILTLALLFYPVLIYDKSPLTNNNTNHYTRYCKECLKQNNLIELE